MGYFTLKQDLEGINDQIKECEELLQQSKMEQKQFLNAMQRYYRSFGPSFPIESFRRFKKWEIDIKKNSHNAEIAAPARILSDIRFLCFLKRNGVDIDALME